MVDGPLTLTLRACSAQGTTWAVAHASLADPAQVAPTLRALSHAAAVNVGLSAVPTDVRPWAPRGATPNEAAVRWRTVGRLPDGRAVEARTGVFAHGVTVIQATMIGAPPADDAGDTFFDGFGVRE